MSPKIKKLSMQSDKGIFVLPVLRKILDKMTYLDKYPDLDLIMSDSNIGGRKNKNIRNHLFIIHGVIKSVMQGEENCVVYDLEQCFEALWLEDCLNDMYDSLHAQSRDDKLALVAVNTGWDRLSALPYPR